MLTISAAEQPFLTTKIDKPACSSYLANIDN